MDGIPVIAIRIMFIRAELITWTAQNMNVFRLRLADLVK
jgi:hypothetical protein